MIRIIGLTFDSLLFSVLSVSSVVNVLTPSIATIHVDGGSRGNPGPAAFAFVIRVPGLSLIHI